MGAADLTPARAGRRQGRFLLQRELGRGAQATVWLAHDPRLQRDVALKLLDLEHSDASQRDQWLHEARAVSSLSHPNVVPVFEADEGEGRPYLVFEFVDGPTLAQQRKQRSAWPAREAVALMMGVLDALAAAHEQGIVHRDLKPSNVLVGRDGRPRVMDFGIAARVDGGGDGLIVGTAGYMSPEAARGEPPHPAMDVFAAGVMLGELLSGAPLMRESDPYRALERIQREDLVLPSALRIDDALRGIVQRALARDPAKRYDGARALHSALQAWLEPPAPEPQVAASHGTLEFLLRRMRHKTDFPALSDSVVRIQRMAASDKANIAALAEEVMGDVALTAKLLRMVNSVHFAAAGAGGITTVSRAVALVGFAGIRNMAMAVLLLEHMSDKGHATQVREELLRAMLGAAVASELEPRARDSEDAFLGTLMQNLGRLLTEFYLPDEAVQIRQLVADASDSKALEAAAVRVLGLSFDELGAGVARSWGLPEPMQQNMRRPAGEPPTKTLPPGCERMRWLGQAATSTAEAVIRDGGTDARAAVAPVVARFGAALGVSADDLAAAAEGARTRMADMAQALGLPLNRKRGQPRAAAAPSPAQVSTATLASAFMPAVDDKTQLLIEGAPPALDAEQVLRAAQRRIESATQSRSVGVNDLLHDALQAILSALNCRAVLFFLRDPKSGGLIARFGVGALTVEPWRIQPDPAGDLFGAVAARAVDTLIADAASVARRLPPWFAQRVRAGTFLLLPVALKGVPLGLIYIDALEPHALKPSAEELQALRAVRDAVLAALTSGSSGRTA